MELKWTKPDGTSTEGTKDAMMKAFYESGCVGSLEPINPPPVIPASYFKEAPMPDGSFDTAEMVCGRNCGSTDFARDTKLGLDYCTNCGAISGFCGVISGFLYGGQQQVSTPKPAPAATPKPAPQPEPVPDEFHSWQGSFTRLTDGEFGVKLWMPDQPDFDSKPAEGDFVQVTSRKGRVFEMYLGKHVETKGRAVIFEKGDRA